MNILAGIRVKNLFMLAFSSFAVGITKACSKFLSWQKEHAF
jgi:hypothetical protein